MARMQMTRLAATALAAFALSATAGCSTCCQPCGRSDPGPKTLLAWSAAADQDDPDCQKENETNGKKNGNGESGNGGDGAAEDPGPIVTDRPDFTEASSTVGKGRIQLEAGYTYIRDRATGHHRSEHSYPEALLRIGMFADWFELRLGQNFASAFTLTTEVDDTITGGEDLYLGVKLALTEQKRHWPETAVILQTTIPTGHPDLTAKQMLPGINFLFGWDLVEDFLSMGGSFQGNRAIDDAEHYYLEVAASWTIGYTLTEKLGAYTEWFALFPNGAVAADVGPEQYLDGGFTYKLTPDFQLDIRAGIGLNQHADDFFAGSGFAIRF